MSNSKEKHIIPMWVVAVIAIASSLFRSCKPKDESTVLKRPSELQKAPRHESKQPARTNR